MYPLMKSGVGHGYMALDEQPLQHVDRCGSERFERGKIERGAAFGAGEHLLKLIEPFRRYRCGLRRRRRAYHGRRERRRIKRAELHAPASREHVGDLFAPLRRQIGGEIRGRRPTARKLLAG